MKSNFLLDLADKLGIKINRREALRYLGGSTIGIFLAGSFGNKSSSMSNDGSKCAVIKSETAGPFPADGSNWPNVLSYPAVFRRDIRSNLDGTNVQDGTEFTLKITVVDASNNCEPVSGTAVYLWHCNAAGEYSAYAGMGQSDQTDSSFLRGVQVTDSNGQATFTTIYPGRYWGRATHFHAAIYKDESLTTKLKTTQFAFDEPITNKLYASSNAYIKSKNTREITNSEDNVFRDGYDGQLLDISGDPTSGYLGKIVVGIYTQAQ